MKRITVKRFNRPDETRPFVEKGRAEILKLGEVAVSRGTFEPGWRWSTHVKPIAGSDSCEVEHALFVLTGRMKIVMDDGEEVELGPGDAADIPPGHDGWVVGSEPCVTLDFAGASQFARFAHAHPAAAIREHPEPLH